MAEDGALSELGCRRQYEPSMSLLDESIGFVFTGIGAAPKAYEFTLALESS
jgi:hypothetical protein